MIVLLNCAQCGHNWTPRIENPKMCPKCKSRKWSEPSKNSHAKLIELLQTLLPKDTDIIFSANRALSKAKIDAIHANLTDRLINYGKEEVKSK